jgi:hypothetical protein
MIFLCHIFPFCMVNVLCMYLFFVFMNNFIYMFVFSLIECWQKNVIKKE